ncbi:uncharacterized protein LOC118200009 [Stegodyphus dumicola]|uniref:uncharacterized protein LOC118200009 n=1 Tax=Stegodyphus dumicola TaxID=202533 RepID=UPI0015A97F81|nr:uncharacterized protein LOC118200009 [Stegodyphus dumicola]XP_035227810.1 uncharacterized protein LOC118200009 [Stegodyphus dumicola]
MGSDKSSAGGTSDQNTEQQTGLGATESGRQSTSDIVHPEIPVQETEEQTGMGATESGQQSTSDIVHPEIHQTEEQTGMGARESGQPSTSDIVHPEIPVQETKEQTGMAATGSGQLSAGDMVHPEIPVQETKDPDLPQAAIASNTTLSNLQSTSGLTDSTKSAQVGSLSRQPSAHEDSTLFSSRRGQTSASKNEPTSAFVTYVQPEPTKGKPEDSPADPPRTDSATGQDSANNGSTDVVGSREDDNEFKLISGRYVIPRKVSEKLYTRKGVI